jgi:hypothetical protein
MIAGLLDLTINKGSTFYRAFTWKDDAGTPINITGWTIQCDVRKSTSGAFVFSLGGSITDGAAGAFQFLLSDETTNTLQNGLYRYDVIFDKDDGTRTDPVISGNVTVSGVYSQKS